MLKDIDFSQANNSLLASSNVPYRDSEKLSYFKEYRTLIPHVIKREREDGGKQSLKEV